VTNGLKVRCSTT